MMDHDAALSQPETCAVETLTSEELSQISGGGRENNPSDPPYGS